MMPEKSFMRLERTGLAQTGKDCQQGTGSDSEGCAEWRPDYVPITELGRHEDAIRQLLEKPSA
jgi:hypothetical protein